MDTADKISWEEFVIEHGAKAKCFELAAVVGQSQKDVQRVRNLGACRNQTKGKEFSELFSLYHGRLPADEEWPVPIKYGNKYIWNAVELALLASLVGRLSPSEISVVLTNRLREITGDLTAERSTNSIQVRTNKIGMQTRDVLGGITTSEAGREIGSIAIINQMIHNKQIKAKRVGRLWVIPHDQWKAWKAKRTFPPAGYVQLSTIKDALAIKSDKLSEFARMGHIPTAVRCNPYGTKGPNTQFGTWFIDNKVAEKMLADRRAGRPMPWHGKPLQDNLRVTFKLWGSRKHPKSCETCAKIWGEKGAPKSYADYEKRYPPLEHGAKRHLTREWNPGFTMQELAEKSLRSVSFVKRAIDNGVLESTKQGRVTYISKTEATRWITRKCPTGENEKSWIAIPTAQSIYLFSESELNSYIADGTLKTVIGKDGAQKGIVYVSRYQCANLRSNVGFSEAEAAKRVGVSIPKFRILLEGVNWRKAEGIPLSTVQAVIKRLQSQEGYTVEEAAKKLDVTVQWVKECIADGLIKVVKTHWDGRRVYITERMLEKLKEAKNNPIKKDHFNEEWLRLSDAAHEAGVTAGTIMKWATTGLLARKSSDIGWRYHREAVRAQAREYWKTVRFHRVNPPDWLVAELSVAEE